MDCVRTKNSKLFTLNSKLFCTFAPEKEKD